MENGYKYLERRWRGVQQSIVDLAAKVPIHFGTRQYFYGEPTTSEAGLGWVSFRITPSTVSS